MLQRRQKLRILPAIILRRLGLAKYLNYTADATVLGAPLKVPMNEGMLESLLMLKPDFKTDILDKLEPIAETGYFVDIGANFGQTLVEVVARDPDVRYFGFEPNPEAFRLLSKLARLNGLQVTLYPWACGDAEQPLQLFATSEADAGATVIPSTRPDTYDNVSGFWIACYPLDLSIDDAAPLNFVLKIDVEGAENEVIKGAARVLEQKRPFVLCEVLHAHRASEIKQNDLRKVELEKLLRGLGYSIYLCNLPPQGGSGLLGLQPISSFSKDQIYKDSPHTCDYLFVPSELRDRFNAEICGLIRADAQQI